MSMISEITEYLETNGVGTQGTDLFYSQFPDNDDLPAVVVIDRPGTKPNIDITDIKSPMFQIIVRSATYATGESKLSDVRALLHGVINTYLVANGIYFRRIQATSEGGHIGVNDAGMDEFSINFTTEIIE